MSCTHEEGQLNPQPPVWPPIADLSHVHDHLTRIEQAIADQIAQNLDARVQGIWQGTDDDLFGTHTSYVVSALFPSQPPTDAQAIRSAWRHGLHLRPAYLWIDVLAPLVVDAERRLGAEIHKGVPLYNTGLCFFAAGDTVRAAQYMDAAGREDDRRMPGTQHVLITGNGIADQLFQIVVPWLTQQSGTDYQAATGKTLDVSEGRNLLNLLAAQHIADAVLALAAIQRFALIGDTPDVYALRLYRVRALADLLLVLESNLGAQNIGQQNLYNRAQALAGGNNALLQYFNTQHTTWRSRAGNYPGSSAWGDLNFVNTFITDQIQAFDAAGPPTEKAAVALYTSYRMRNALMHVLDDQLILLHNPAPLVRLINFALIALRLAQHHAERTLAQL